MDGAAGQLERFSGYLRHTDLNEMRRDVERFARRQPAAFLGGVFTIGVLAARFLKSSGDSDEGETTALARREPSTGMPSYPPLTPAAPTTATGATSGTGGYRVPAAAGSVADATPPPVTRTGLTSADPASGDLTGATVPAGGATGDAWTERARTGDPKAPTREGQ